MVPWALSMWGQTLIDQGRLRDGLDHLEEAMALLVDQGLSPRVTPWVYCAAVRGCCLARDFARARDWNRSMGRWLDSLSSLGGAYLGNCRIYRSRLMLLNGAWTEADDEIGAVCADLDGYTGWVCGHAFYQLGEVRRLRGEWDAAEDAYRRAAENGCPTQPGLALLRLAEGDLDAASAGVRRALTEVTATPDRVDLLKAAATIYLEQGNIEAARDAVAEFEKIARASDDACHRGRAERRPRRADAFRGESRKRTSAPPASRRYLAGAERTPREGKTQRPDRAGLPRSRRP